MRLRERLKIIVKKVINLTDKWLELVSKVKCPGYEFGEHTADVLVIARGRTLEELFEVAAKAVYEIITDTSKVMPKIEVKVEDTGIDLYNLLYRFIEDLLYYTDSEGLVFSKFNVERIWKSSEDEWHITAKAWGEPFDPQRHEHRTIVKAMTYAQMRIEKDPQGCYSATFVPDI
jgi:SHS2 domain-containing protein